MFKFVSLACEVNKMFLCFFAIRPSDGVFWQFHKIHADEWSLKPNLIAARYCQTSGAFHLREKIKAGVNFSPKQLKFSTKKLRRGECLLYDSVWKPHSGRDCSLSFSAETTVYFIKMEYLWVEYFSAEYFWHHDLSLEMCLSRTACDVPWQSKVRFRSERRNKIIKICVTYGCVIFFLACERAEFSKSCNLIGSGSGRKFSILPAHGAIPPG